MSNDEIQAHSADDTDDAACGVQLGRDRNDVVAHSAADDADDAAGCGVQLGRDRL
jgi:hypothetical protein